MIKVQATEAMGFDQQTDELLFTLKRLDWETSTIEMKCEINAQNIDHLIDAVEKAFVMLYPQHDEL